MQRLLELDGGDGCMTIGIYLIPLPCTLIVNMVNCLHVFNHNKKSSPSELFCILCYNKDEKDSVLVELLVIPPAPSQTPIPGTAIFRHVPQTKSPPPFFFEDFPSALPPSQYYKFYHS